MVNADPRDIGWDEESYPNVYTCVLTHIESGYRWIYEISDWQNHSKELFDMVYKMRSHNMRMIGFNSLGYDYPLLHHIMNMISAQGYVTAQQIYTKSQQLIAAKDRWVNMIWDNQRAVDQIDLFSIHHFDNKAKYTGLKALEINMRSHTVEDLPYDPLVPLTQSQVWPLITYNCHDVDETNKFYFHTLPMIKFREELTERYGQNFMNHNDTKLGKDFFIMELEKKQKGLCYDYSSGRKVKRQTPRDSIPIGPLILPYIQFQHPELQRVLDYVRTVTLTVTKDPPELKNLHAMVNGFKLDFGAGGLHGSVSKRVIRTTATHIIIDCDVVSYYPSIPIKNRFYPEHLTEVFCEVYADLLRQRKSFAKGTPENAMLKLALNGVYGESGQEHGVFLDPKYMMSVTFNGQFSLAMLTEWLTSQCEAEMIQANTDGLTVRIPREKMEAYYAICKHWETYTGLELEYVEYDGMWIRDVNNYLSRSMKGSVKRVGAYQHVRPDEPGKAELGWHQDHSALITAKAAEAVMLNGADLETFIRTHDNAFDFMCRAKVPRSSRLMHGDSRIQNTSRYFISTDGKPLVKVMPPLEKKPGVERPIAINAGWNVSICNVLDDWDWSKLDYRWYVEETKKLILTNGDV